jgi:hypothetical protein
MKHQLKHSFVALALSSSAAAQFTSLPPVAGQAQSTTCATIADYDGDGINDILAGALLTDSAGNTTTRVVVYLAQAGGGYAAPFTVPVATAIQPIGRPSDIIALNIDSDGRADPVLATDYGMIVYWLSSTGANVYLSSGGTPIPVAGGAPLVGPFGSTSGSGDPVRLTRADTNGDGVIDFAAAGSLFNGLGGLTPRFSSYAVSLATGTVIGFPAATLPATFTGNDIRIAAGNITSPGGPQDLVISDGTTIDVMSLNLFSPTGYSSSFAASVFNAPCVEVDDFDGDGLDNLAIQDNLQLAPNNRPLFVARNTGVVTAPFAASSTFASLNLTFGTPSDLVLADLDADGDREFLTLHPGAPGVPSFFGLHLNQGGGFPLFAGDVQSLEDWNRVVAGNLGGISSDDLVLTGSSSGSGISILIL